MNTLAFEPLVVAGMGWFVPRCSRLAFLTCSTARCLVMLLPVCLPYLPCRALLDILAWIRIHGCYNIVARILPVCTTRMYLPTTARRRFLYHLPPACLLTSLRLHATPTATAAYLPPPPKLA